MTTVELSYVDGSGTTRTVRAGGLEGDYLEATPGTSLSIPFYTDQQDLTVASGETYTVAAGETEYFGKVTVESGGTFDVDGTAVVAELVDNGTTDVDGEIQVTGTYYTAYNRIRDVIDAAGNGTVETDYQGTPLYQDIVRPKANVNSMVVKVSAIDIPELRDLWVFVTGGEDRTQILASRESFEWQTTVIAPVSEYSDRTTLSNALETTGLQF